MSFMNVNPEALELLARTLEKARVVIEARVGDSADIVEELAAWIKDLKVAQSLAVPPRSANRLVRALDATVTPGKPTIGRIVHVHDLDAEEPLVFPAIVTDVDAWTEGTMAVNVMVFGMSATDRVGHLNDINLDDIQLGLLPHRSKVTENWAWDWPW